MCGDPLYFAPEMIGGGAGYSYPVDFWALGVLMFEMFTARLPFGAPGAGETAVYAAIAKGDFDAPEDAPPALADAWAVLLKQEYSRANAIDLRHHALFKNNVDLDRLKDRSAEPPFRALVDNRARSLIAADGTLGAFDDFRGGLAKAASSNVWQFRSY